MSSVSDTSDLFNPIDLIIPDNQQEDESDLPANISFRDAVVMNADWTIETINSQMNKGNIDLQPGFQRRAAWDDTRKSRLLESIIVGMPVPNIVLAENKAHRGRFIVIDGKQRLLAINNFCENDLILRGLDIRNDLNGKSFNSLPDDDREMLENSTLRSTVIKNWADEDFLYAIFFRLNSGSLPLSPQELRKALIGGNLLEEIESYLSASSAFKSIFGLQLDKRMRDSELVLRFIAYDKGLNDYRGDFKKFLDTATKYFETDWDNKRVELQGTLERMDLALETTFKIFAKDSFKKWLGTKYERVINRALFDCIVRFFSEKDVCDAAVQHATLVQDVFHELCLDRDFLDAVEKTPKTVQATDTRINMWGNRLAECLGMRYDATTRRVV
jgi:hypothetical protein